MGLAIETVEPIRHKSVITSIGWLKRAEAWVFGALLPHVEGNPMGVAIVTFDATVAIMTIVGAAFRRCRIIRRWTVNATHRSVAA